MGSNDLPCDLCLSLHPCPYSCGKCTDRCKALSHPFAFSVTDMHVCALSAPSKFWVPMPQPAVRKSAWAKTWPYIGRNTITFPPCPVCLQHFTPARWKLSVQHRCPTLQLLRSESSCAVLLLCSRTPGRVLPRHPSECAQELQTTFL